MGVHITRKEKMGFGKDVESTVKLLEALDPTIKEAAVAYLNKQSNTSPVMNTLIQGAVNELQVNPNVELETVEVSDSISIHNSGKIVANSRGLLGIIDAFLRP